jgi:phage/plasmid-like protein (TIGR03299 family)
MNTNENNYANSIINATFANTKLAENSYAVNALLDEYNLNWSVSKQRLTLPNGTETQFYGIVRDDKQITFSTCKDGYQPFQNSELAEMLIRLSEKTGYEMKGGGMFNNGAKLYLQLLSPNKINNIGKNDDIVEGYLTGINSHDGSSSLKWGETNITISCKNTFNAALKAINNSARHNNNMRVKVEQAIKEIDVLIEEEKNMFDIFIKMSETPVTRKAIARIVKDITEVDTLLSQTEIAEKYTTYSINRSGELLQAIAKETEQKGQTMWGLMSGITNYTTHIMPAPKRDNGRMESLYVGTGYNINNDAFTTLKNIIFN